MAGPKEIQLKLALQISHYWARRGATVNAHVVRSGADDNAVYQLKSDMINGLPRGVGPSFLSRMKKMERENVLQH